MTAMDEKTFDLLEDRVRKAADAVRRLKSENASLVEQLGKARTGAGEMEKRLVALEKEKSAVGAASLEVETAKAEIKTLRAEREEVKKRIGKIVALLDELEA